MSNTDNINMNNFKGIYYNDDQEQNYFEGGAHFSYKDLCYILEKMRICSVKKETHQYEDTIQIKQSNSTIQPSNVFLSDNSRNIQTFSLQEQSSTTNHHLIFDKKMDLSMYNNACMNVPQNEGNEDSSHPKKQISITKSTRSNTRNSNNNNDKTNSTHINFNKMISCTVDKVQLYKFQNKGKYLRPANNKVIAQKILLDSKKMVRFTSRIKSNLAKPKNPVPLNEQHKSLLLKQKSGGIKVNSIAFDKIGVYKNNESKSRNHYSQRDNNSTNLNSSYLRGQSNEKHPMKKTIEFISRNKMCPSSTINLKIRYSNEKHLSGNSDQENITHNIDSRNTNSKKSIHKTLVHSNYTQKYLQKIIKSTFDINKRPQGLSKALPRKINN